jgi:hypothetical protein
MVVSGGGMDRYPLTDWAVIVEVPGYAGARETRVLAEVQGSREDALAELLRQAERYQRRRKQTLYRDGDTYMISSERAVPLVVFRVWERVHVDG